MTASGVHKTDAQTSLSLHAPPHLPCVLVEEILSRLTVKHLLQLCCVCKSWNSLISCDSKFAKKHLHFSTSTDGRHHLAHRSDSVNNSCELRLWKSPISSFFISEAASTDSFTKLSHPLIKLGYEEVSTCDEALPFAAFTSLLVEMVAKLDHVMDKVEELGRMSHFKEFRDEDDENIVVT
ncbi:hypothetical protein TSUD_01630 [Trifolium subterraneum]|nr:hypothetical protein TSUD_01630 [Trifolium subterraneum]